MLLKTLLSLLAFVLTGSITLASPAPSEAHNSKRDLPLCTNPIQRKEWRTLTTVQKQAYIAAVQCILTKPALTPKSVAAGAVSRYDDLVVTHVQQFNRIHFTGAFLPWHRYYTSVYEQMLRKECGYTGAQPYWDWTLDVPPYGEFTSSPMWDPQTGFGGNGPYVAGGGGFGNIPGRTGGGCVQNGPFTNMTVRIGPQTSLSGNPRCLHRDFAPTYANQNVARSVLDSVLNKTTFLTMVQTMESGAPSSGGFPGAGGAPTVHGGGHFSVGGSLGEMGDPYVSVADPVFWLHHANLDRVWWSWQKKDLNQRLSQVEGPLIMYQANSGATNLDTKIDIGYSATAIPIRDVMDVRNSFLCYDYDVTY